MDSKTARLTVGEPLIRTAVAAGVSEPTARLYEANPEAIKDPAKRRQLDAVYATYRARAQDCPAA